MAQCDLAEDIEEKDAHVFAEMAKRKRALLSLRWDINSPRNATAAEQKQAEQIAEWCGDLPMDDLILDLSDAIHKGFSCVEIQWQRMGKIWLPSTLSHRESRWFTVPQSNRNELRLRDNSLDGEPLRPLNWLVHCHKAKSGYLTRSGPVPRVGLAISIQKLLGARPGRIYRNLRLAAAPGQIPQRRNRRRKKPPCCALCCPSATTPAGIMPQGMEMRISRCGQGRGRYLPTHDRLVRTQPKARPFSAQR